MGPDAQDVVRVRDMLDGARAVLAALGGPPVVDASPRILRLRPSVEIISAAAARVSVRFKQAHPEIPWESIDGDQPPVSEAWCAHLVRLLEKIVPPQPPDDA